MRLCELCESIPFQRLPAFPQGCYHAGSSGKQYIHHYFRRKGCPDDATAAVDAARIVRYHATIESLRAAAAECDLCVLVLGEADALLDELDSLKGDESAKMKYSAPTFDMWLTQRPDGGQGFWIISEPSGDNGGMTIMPIAAFTFVVAEDDPFARFIRGRPVNTTIDSSVLERVRKCIAQYDHEHDSGNQCTVRPVPKRLLELYVSKSDDSDTIRLVELDSDCPQKYAALSYASEPGIVSCLEPQELFDGAKIPSVNLAKTFQDAILVARTLGLQYLWIDSLCIPGSVTGWQRWSPQAGAVYSNAYVTISATGAANALGGLFFSRPKRKYAQIRYKADDGTAGSVLVSSLPLAKEVNRTRYMDMKEEPISTGVWSFQERVLSQRVVHFASDQIYVEHTQDFLSEDGLSERMRYHTTAEALSIGTKDYRLATMSRGPVSRWFSLLWDYARRVPMNSADKLTALSNVARAFKPMSDGAVGEYVAGHWTSSLVESLCWQSLRSKPAGDIAAPSWSWVSVDGIVGMGFAGGISHHCLATVVDTHITLADDNTPFGRVTAGTITLQAPPLIPVKVVTDEEVKLGSFVYRRMRMQSEYGSKEGVLVGMDTKEKRHVRPCDALDDRELFALVLAETHRDEECARKSHDPESTLHGLIVTPATSSGGESMRRLGFFLAEAAALGPGSLFSTQERVTLV